MYRLGFIALIPRAVAGVAVFAAVTGLLFAPPSASQTPSEASSASIPRLSNGKPDLTGMWDGRAGGAGAANARFEKIEDDGDVSRLFPSRRCAPNQQGCRDNTNQANDFELTFRTYTNKPMYKPEHWDKVQFLDYDLNFSDPSFRCLPDGVPRMGVPAKIIQSANEVTFLYGDGESFRVIPTDGRQHDPNAFPSFLGDSVGRWEGDTLIIDTVSRNDTTWLGGHGYFHSFNLHIVEKFRREGNTIHYETTVEDPDVLLQPWVMDPRVMRLNTDPQAKIEEARPCVGGAYHQGLAVSRIRH